MVTELLTLKNNRDFRKEILKPPIEIHSKHYKFHAEACNEK